MKILIIGGNRFFGKKLTKKLLADGHDVTLLNRGNIDDGFGSKIQRIKCDRSDPVALASEVGNTKWDLIYDQVCFVAPEAEAACEIFKGKVGHYIFTSSQSVYDRGQDLTELDFDPEKHEYNVIADKFKDYPEAKRQCETVFFKNAAFSFSAVRFPIVVGRDDYTKRFHFHIERILDHEEIYFPNINAKMSMISSDDAAHVLHFLAKNRISGPLNAASAEPIILKEFVAHVETEVRKKIKLSNHYDAKTCSPYGIEADWYMNTDKLKKAGCNVQPIMDWLDIEIKAVLKS